METRRSHPNFGRNAVSDIGMDRRSQILQMLKPMLLIIPLFLLLSSPVLAGSCYIKDGKWDCDKNAYGNECEKKEDCWEIADAFMYDAIRSVLSSTTKTNMKVLGTEYWQGERGTIFLQLRDSNGEAVNDGQCYATIYYPNINNTHEAWITDGLMLHQSDSEGLYYYDFNVPITVGVYMVEAYCEYTVDSVWYYTADSGEYPNRSEVLGVYTGQTFVLNDYADSIYTKCYAIGKECDTYYDFVLDNTTIDHLDVVYLGETIAISTMTMYAWNWTNSSWGMLLNQLVFSGTATSTSPSGIDEYVSNMIDTGYVNANGSVKIRLDTTSGTTLTLYSNWLNLRASQIGMFVQDVRGAGELNVHSISTFGGGGSTGSPYYDIYTFCGDSEGMCAKFVNDTDFDLPEGALEDNITVVAYANINDTYWSYQMYDTSTCESIYWIKTNQTGTWEYVDLSTVKKNTYSLACLLEIPINLTSGERYDYIVRFDNYQKYKIIQIKYMIDHINITIEPMCVQLAEIYNITYELPINNSLDLQALYDTDEYLYMCYLFNDMLYWSDYFFKGSQTVYTIGEYQGYFIQFQDFIEPQLMNLYTLWDTIALNNTIKIEHNITRELITSEDNALNNTLNSHFNTTWENQQQIFNEIQANNQSNYIWFETTWNNQATTFSFMQTMNSTIYVFHNVTMTEINTIKDVVQSVFDWLEYQISVLS